MIKLEVIDSSRFASSQWSGGVTTQLFIAPCGASYAERRFDYRISTAVVELEESVFTRLEGVKRFLTPLCENGFRLTINGAPEFTLEKGRVLEFSGEDDVVCRGSGRDLNLMLKNAKGDMRCVKAGERFTVHAGCDCFIYAAEDLEIVSDTASGLSLALRTDGFAYASAEEKAGELIATGALVLFTVCRS